MKVKPRVLAVVAAAGAFLALAVQTTGWSASAPAASISLSKSVGPPTTRLILSGTGFGTTEQVNITFDTHRLAKATTDGAGAFSKRVKIPSQALPGDHTLTATGRTSGETASAVFTVRTDWAMFQFSPDRRGENHYENVLSPSTVGGLELKWTVQMPDAITSSPAVVGGVVYQGDGDESFFAIDADTGTVLWTKSLGVYGGLSTPAVANGIVYVGAVAGDIFALDADDGTLIWTKYLGGLIFDSPLVVNGVVYISAGSGSGTLYALDAGTGETIWITGGGGGFSSPAYSAGMIFIGAGNGTVLGLDPDTGWVLWSIHVNADIGAGPAVSEGLVYVGTSNYGPARLYVLDAATGVVAWSHGVGGSIHGSPAVADGVVYFGSTDDKVYALDAASGTPVWSLTTGDDVWSSAVVANGVAYVSSKDENFYALDSSTGAILWTYSAGAFWDEPAITDGAIYVSSFDGKIYAFGLP